MFHMGWNILQTFTITSSQINYLSLSIQKAFKIQEINSCQDSDQKCIFVNTLRGIKEPRCRVMSIQFDFLVKFDTCATTKFCSQPIAVHRQTDNTRGELCRRQIRSVFVFLAIASVQVITHPFLIHMLSLQMQTLSDHVIANVHLPPNRRRQVLGHRV